MTRSGVVFDFGGVFQRGKSSWLPDLEKRFGLTGDEVRSLVQGPGAVEAQLGGAPFSTTDMMPVVSERLAPHLGAQASDAAREFLAIYLDPGLSDYDQSVMAIASGLHQSGVVVGIVTNAPADCEFGTMAPVLDLGCIDATVISGRDGIGKPSAGAFNLILERMGVSVAESCYVDDQPFQAEAAEALGITSFVYQGDAEQLSSWLRSQGHAI